MDSGPIAVSYTHLDVYKRQEFGRQITVEFTGVLDLESNQEIYRKTMEAAEAAIPKACLLYTSRCV